MTQRIWPSEMLVRTRNTALPDRRYLAQLRRRIRALEYHPRGADWGGRRHVAFDSRTWDSGGCGIVSEVINVRYGIEMDGGCYLPNPWGMVGEPGTEHIAHVWNRLPDGRILDTTADQFAVHGDVFPARADGIRVTAASDPRYLPECDCDTTL